MDLSAPLAPAALAHLGPHGHPLALEALRAGAVSLDPAAHHWDSSHGPVSAHPVVVWVDAALLGALTRSVSAQENLLGALSAALSVDPLVTVHALRLRWDGTLATAAAAPYRGAAGRARVTDDDARRDALAAFLGEAEPAARDWLRTATGVWVDGAGRWRVRGVETRPTKAMQTALDGAVRALTNDAVGALQTD